jgi:CBS domain-containing protein
MMCQDVMKSEVKFVSLTTTVEDVAAVMRDEGVGFLPVCDAQRRVVGTITDRDIAIRAVAEGESMDQPIESFMTMSVVGCRVGDDLRHAQELMSQKKVSRITCVNDKGILEGIISLSDIAQLGDGVHAFATLRAISDREVRL